MGGAIPIHRVVLQEAAETAGAVKDAAAHHGHPGIQAQAPAMDGFATTLLEVTMTTLPAEGVHTIAGTVDVSR